jgi:hypothetical protein
LFRVCRKENGEIGKDGKPIKIYVQQRKTQAGYINGVNGVRQVPYKLPDIIKSIERGDDGHQFRLVSEAHRIRLAHLFDPVLAVHTSVVEPLPPARVTFG